MEIIWDERKRTSNLAKHGYDFADLSGVFFETATELGTYGGRRLAIGRFGTGSIVVVYRPLGSEAISVISMRPADRKERSRVHD